MKSRVLIVALLATMFVLCGLLAYRNAVLTELLSVKDVMVKNLISSNVTMSPQFDLNIKNCGQILNEDIIDLRDVNGGKVSLKKFFEENNNLLICRYSDNYCQQCTDYALYNLSKVGCENVIFIGNCSKGEKISEQIKEYGLSNRIVLNCRNMYIQAELMQFPYYMAIDRSLKIKGIYMPNKASSHQKIDSINLDLLYRYCVSDEKNANAVE